jgi:predicted glycoside hydrolase/deacetylase ChbG (UPF0249 family)
VESDFVEDMKKVGIQVNTIYFSGFSSQGDGACFVGAMDNTLTYLDHHHVDQYPMIRKLLEHDGEVYVKCKHSGHYYHENCTEFWADSDTLTGMVDQPTEFHEAIVEEWQRLLEDEVNNFETDVTEQWRTYMQQLYRKLEAEYDHLTSDDAVWDTIEANELIEDLEEEDA